MEKKDYKRLGDYVHEVDVRNTGMLCSKLVGLTISKAFIPSVANTIGTDLSKYKIIKENQFACSLMQVSRDGKIPVAIYKGENAIMSPAYPIFEVCSDELLPDYLQMWFSRDEFDREATFYAVGGVRGSLDWDDFMDMRLPIPSVDKQREIVTQYKAIERRVNIDKELITDLEETAKAIYRKMYVDDIEPENLPSGWKRISVFDASEVRYGFPYDSELFCEDTSLFPVVRIRDILANESTTFTSENPGDKYIIKDSDILVGMDGVFHMTIWHGPESYQNQRVVRFRCKEEMCISPYHLLYSIQGPIKEFESSVEGTTVAHLGDKEVKTLSILVAPKSEQESIYAKFTVILNAVRAYKHELFALNRLLSLLLSKMSSL